MGYFIILYGIVGILIFKLEDKWMIAKSIGWDKADSYEEAVNIVIKQQF